MKKLFVFLSVLFCATYSFAQMKWGIEAGVNLSRFVGSASLPSEKKAKPSREERGYTEPRGPKKKDDWKQFFAPENSKWLKGEKPDFEEEGWARRKPKKK